VVRHWHHDPRRSSCGGVLAPAAEGLSGAVAGAAQPRGHRRCDHWSTKSVVFRGPGPLRRNAGLHCAQQRPGGTRNKEKRRPRPYKVESAGGVHRDAKLDGGRPRFQRPGPEPSRGGSARQRVRRRLRRLPAPAADERVVAGAGPAQAAALAASGPGLEPNAGLPPACEQRAAAPHYAAPAIAEHGPHPRPQGRAGEADTEPRRAARRRLRHPHRTGTGVCSGGARQARADGGGGRGAAFRCSRGFRRLPVAPAMASPCSISRGARTRKPSADLRPISCFPTPTVPHEC